MKGLVIGEEIKQKNASAFHESGHVVFAYLCGYHCLEMQLMNSADEEGVFSYALIDYGEDEDIALKFIGENANNDHFRNLSLSERLRNIEVGQRLGRLFTGGSVAVAVYRNGNDVQIPFPMQMDHLDLVKLEYIHSVIAQLMVNSDIDFLEQEITGALYTISNPYIWKSIQALASRLLDLGYLSKNDIEECLESTKLLPLFN